MSVLAGDQIAFFGVSYDFCLSLMRTAAIVAGAVAAWSIPRILARSAEQRERLSASLSLVWEIKHSPAILERSARTYAFRKFQAGAVGYKDPYADGYYTYEHDLVCILNFFDAAAIQIAEGHIDRSLIKKTSEEVVVGAYKLLDVLDELLEGDQHKNFPNLVLLGQEWQSDVPSSEIEIPKKRER